MSYPTSVSIAILLFVLTACGDGAPAAEEAANPDLSTALLGTWETVEFNVDYDTYMGGDTAYVERIREADWGRKYGVNLPSTVFTADGKLRRTHRLKTGQVANITNGIWKAQGDSLFVIEPNITYTYYPELDGDRLELSGVVDQDQDGVRDDKFRAVYRLVSRTR
ncbi:hypothetical protein GGR26_000144 [Lewinella marina]|uniref:Lipocalin-like domain-containing protein n=1 Tax=Neolewinella marina TaxID=438751 RepID=A0A2G0CKA9_9BACT|nr:hypothetical protein [Neolewinella marina]NJB84399.1 hypothetical protein [Neolewinella marina]PHL00406.1 hypothetical protein CGL56_05065 [Neolewinella marina]